MSKSVLKLGCKCILAPNVLKKCYIWGLSTSIIGEQVLELNVTKKFSLVVFLGRTNRWQSIFTSLHFFKNELKGEEEMEKTIFLKCFLPFMCQSFKAKCSNALEMRNYLKTSTLHATTAQITPCCPVRFNLPDSFLEGMIWDLVTM